MIRFNLSTLALAACALSMSDGAEPVAGAAVTPATPTGTAPKAAKPKTIADDMASRVILADVSALNAYFGQLSGYEGFADAEGNPLIQFATPGVSQDDSGFVLDPAIYLPGVEIAVELMTEKGKDGEASKPKAILIRPNPSLDLVLDSEAGRAWLYKIATKEFNLVATRPLRKVDRVEEAVGAMPLALADYITGRELSGSQLEAYNKHWESIKKTLSKASKTFALTGLSKKTLRMAIESKAFAAQNFPLLESVEGQDSWFVLAAKLGGAFATKAGDSPDIFTNWLASRDTYEIPGGDDGEEAPVDFAALLAAATAEPAPTATPAPATTA